MFSICQPPICSNPQLLFLEHFLTPIYSHPPPFIQYSRVLVIKIKTLLLKNLLYSILILNTISINQMLFCNKCLNWIQIMTGTAAATFPISSSVCIIFFILAFKTNLRISLYRHKAILHNDIEGGKGPKIK